MRALLYLYGILAVRTKPLEPEEAKARVDSWKNVYGHRVKVGIEDQLGCIGHSLSYLRGEE